MRLILDTAHSATFNMAADEFLMEQQSLSDGLPTLRIYTWDVPSVSIGYFQDVAKTTRRFHEGATMVVVKRITGGGLVQHGSDLTFSLALRKNNPYLPSDVKMSYLKVNEALRLGLKDLYPELDYADCKTAPSGRGDQERICFEKPSCYDLLVGGKKVVGASQRRREGAILHQSSVFLKDPKPVLIEKILSGFRKLWNIEFQDKPFNPAESALIRIKELQRYGSPEWASPVISI